MEKYEGLLHKLARKAYGRLAMSGADAVADFDDCYQEACMAYLNAVRCFNEEAGVQFITYLWRTVENSLSRFVKDGVSSTINEFSVDAEIDEDGSTILDMIESPILSPEEQIERKQTFSQNIARLGSRDPVALRLVRNIIEATDDMENEFRMNHPGADDYSLRDIVMHVTGGDKTVRARVRKTMYQVYGDLMPRVNL